MQDSTPTPHVVDIWERFSYNPLTGLLYSNKTKQPVYGQSSIDNRNYKRLTVVVRYNGKYTSVAYGKVVYMWIYGYEPDSGYHVDHIDHDSHNNRPSNLRCVTIRENNQNRRNQKSPGIYWNTRLRRWQAQIRHGGKRKYLGIFKSEAEALAVYIQECDSHQYPVLKQVRERLIELQTLELQR